MKLQVRGRHSNRVVVGRLQGAKIAVAIFATAALCLGPAVAATATEGEENAPVSDVTATSVQEDSQTEAEAQPSQPDELVEDQAIIDAGDESETDGQAVDEPKSVPAKQVEISSTDTPQGDGLAEAEAPTARSSQLKQEVCKDLYLQRGYGYDPECQEVPECLTPAGFAAGPQHGSEALSWEGEEGDWGDGEWECPTQPEIYVDPGDCIVATDGEGQYEKGSESLIVGSMLLVGHDYLVTIYMGDVLVFSHVYEADQDGMVHVWAWLDWPGSYVATIVGVGEDQPSASAEFEISECPPEPPAPALTATVTCNAGVMELTIVGTGLYAETMYYVRILGPNEYSETAEMRTSGEGIGSVVMPLAVEGEYEAYIAEVAETSFTATKTCSPPVVTVVNPTPTPPPTTTPPALANTGGGDTSPLLWAGALAMLVASGLMLQSMRARRRES